MSRYNQPCWTWGWLDRERAHLIYGKQCTSAVSHSGVFSFELFEGRADWATRARGEPGLREVCVPSSGSWEGNLLYLSWGWGTQELFWEQHRLRLWLSVCSLIAARQVPASNPPGGNLVLFPLLSLYCGSIWEPQSQFRAPLCRELIMSRIGMKGDSSSGTGWSSVFFSSFMEETFILKWVLELVVFMADLSNTAPSSIFLQDVSSWRPGKRSL